MGQFVYKAVQGNGGQVTGEIEAADRRSAVAVLAERGQFVTELAEQSSSVLRTQDAAISSQASRVAGIGAAKINLTRGRITGKDILSMTSQFNAALRAGLPLLNALEIIRDQQHKASMKSMLTDIANGVRGGESLSDAMANYENVFGRLYISMIRVGETGGILEKTTSQLVKILDREEKIKGNMKTASIYPLFVLGLGLVSVVVILIWILPKILETIDVEKVVLPWPTRFLLRLSDLLGSAFGVILLVALVAGIIWFAKWSKGAGKLTWDSFKLKIPLVGPVLVSIAVGRFAKTLGALTLGGVTILESLSIVRDTMGNERLGLQIDDVAEKVKGGTSLAKPLQDSGYFPPLLVQIVAVGEKTGKLDELLLEAGDTFDEQADSTIAKFLAVFPMLLIMLLAVVIGFIIVAVLLPIVMMGMGSGTW